VSLSKAFWQRWVAKTLLHLAAATPLALLSLRVVLHPESLGANPVATLIHELGLWALRLLLLTLALTPLRHLTHSAVWLLYRRMLGLWAAAYTLLHLLAYVGIDQRFDLPVLIEDVLKRPWITIGFAASLILLVLSITSTRGMMRRLGRRWQTLHTSVYAAALLGLWHFYWQVKKDIRAPLAYAIVFAVLMLIRLVRSRWFKAKFAPATAPGKT
jgi:sulfoxide reductase heme-binding subunit YedZ